MQRRRQFRPEHDRRQSPAPARMLRCDHAMQDLRLRPAPAPTMSSTRPARRASCCACAARSSGTPLRVPLHRAAGWKTLFVWAVYLCRRAEDLREAVRARAYDLGQCVKLVRTGAEEVRRAKTLEHLRCRWKRYAVSNRDQSPYEPGRDAARRLEPGPVPGDAPSRDIAVR